MINFELSLSRIIKLVKIDLSVGFKSVLLWIGAITGLIVLFSVLAGGVSVAAHYIFFSLLLYFGGYISAAQSFSELSNTTEAMHWLTLPGSSIEKYLIRVFYVTIGYVFIAVFVYSLAANLSVFALNAIGRGKTAFFNPLDFRFKDLFTTYLVITFFYIYGALFFRSRHYVKTTASLFALSIVIGFIVFFISKIILFRWFDGFEIKTEFWKQMAASAELGFYKDDMATYESVTKNISNFFFYGVTPVWLFIIGYLRLRETEV